MGFFTLFSLIRYSFPMCLYTCFLEHPSSHSVIYEYVLLPQPSVVSHGFPFDVVSFFEMFSLLWELVSG